MRFQNGKQDVQFILSWFSQAFSRPSFKLFLCCKQTRVGKIPAGDGLVAVIALISILYFIDIKRGYSSKPATP
jgi:hypothetical protein